MHSEPLGNERLLLKQTETLNRQMVGRATEVISNTLLGKLAADYEERQQMSFVDLGLNLFTIVSDLYYRENFHSDILRALLDPHSPHGEGDKYLRLFLEFLNTRGAALTLEDYRDTTVVREEGRLDLLIKDSTSKRAIIVENKMNGAGDMRRQIPRYLQHVKEEQLTCDAIVYLRLNRDQRPDVTDWTAQEVKEIDALLLCISSTLLRSLSVVYDDRLSVAVERGERAYE